MYNFREKIQTSTIMANTTINVIWINTNIMKAYHYN